MTKKLQFWLPIAAYVLLIMYIGWFKVGNTDFWWHIKAGQVFRESGWITIDPFAYTREGLPYLANHEWLAQVLLSLVWDVDGVIGITVLRILIMLLVFSVPVLLHRKNMWVNGTLAVLATVGARPAFTDRPQLFSFLFFSIITCLCIVYLEVDASKRKRILLYLPVGIMLWSNLHGAASLIGIAVVGALVVQRLISGARKTSEWKWLLALMVAMFIALLLTPSGTGNISYIITLLTDKTARSISEWQPAAGNIYLQHTLVLWVASLAALITTRRNIVFSGLVLLGLGYLSRQAVRHEALFIIAALAITIYQLKYNKQWNQLLDKVYKNVKLFCILCILCTLCTLYYAHIRTYDINRIDHLFGIGLFEPGRGAYAFIESQHLEGPIFNNYNIGGELIYRGYPKRKVFIDGRNIDYGYDFLVQATNAGVEESVWRELEAEYGFKLAIIYYAPQAEQNPLPYTDLLDRLDDWGLVYLDDWVAVYKKEERVIKYVTPKMLSRQILPGEIKKEEFSQLQNELNEMIVLRPDGIKARLYLARLYTLLGAYEPAEKLLEDARAIQPNNYLISIGLSQVSMTKEDWPHAWYYLKQAKRKAGFTGVQLDEETMEMV
ncbi:MAG: hypothetical protein KC680_04765, partial [Candidatus Peregrinibacteria bacterium]|nr:hypothetical protein [Candidatus Peregrinibacteria bacterium]